MGGARQCLSKKPDAERAKPMLPQSLVFRPMPGTICSQPHGFRALEGGFLA